MLVRRSWKDRTGLRVRFRMKKGLDLPSVREATAEACGHALKLLQNGESGRMRLYVEMLPQMRNPSGWPMSRALVWARSRALAAKNSKVTS